MATEIGNLSSANGASLQLSDKSGQVAAQLLSGTVEDAGTVQQKVRSRQRKLSFNKCRARQILKTGTKLAGIWQIARVDR